MFRYVSDVGLDGYKWYCQHKALQCGNIEPQLSRVYPPCLLEWRAAQRKANMALEVRFADSKLYSFMFLFFEIDFIYQAFVTQDNIS
jgi:myosin-15